MGRIDVDDVEAGLLRAQCRVAVPAPQIGDIGLVHGARLHRIVGESGDRHMGGAERHLAGIKVRAVGAVVGELDTGQGIVFVHRIGHARERGNVAIVPQPELDVRRDIG